MWPQKWWASASPGLIARPTRPTAEPATIALPTRASRPRRDVRAARSSVSAPSPRRPPSATDRLAHPPLGRRQDGFELAEPVERALGEDRPVAGVEGDGVRGAGDVGEAPEMRVADLVERGDG